MQIRTSDTELENCSLVRAARKPSESPVCTAAFGVNEGLKSQQRPCSAVPGMQETSADVKGVDAEEWKCFYPGSLSKTEHSKLNHSNAPSKGKKKKKTKNTPPQKVVSSPLLSVTHLPFSPTPAPGFENKPKLFQVFDVTKVQTFC